MSEPFDQVLNRLINLDKNEPVLKVASSCNSYDSLTYKIGTICHQYVTLHQRFTDLYLMGLQRIEEIQKSSSPFSILQNSVKEFKMIVIQKFHELNLKALEAIQLAKQEHYQKSNPMLMNPQDFQEKKRKLEQQQHQQLQEFDLTVMDSFLNNGPFKPFAIDQFMFNCSTNAFDSDSLEFVKLMQNSE